MHTVLIQEMKDTLAGFQAYNNGNYVNAAHIFGKKTWNPIALNKATHALTTLAEHSLNQGDIAGARDWYLKAFKIQ